MAYSEASQPRVRSYEHLLFAFSLAPKQTRRSAWPSVDRLLRILAAILSLSASPFFRSSSHSIAGTRRVTAETTDNKYAACGATLPELTCGPGRTICWP